MKPRKVILDLCGGTGSWSLPYIQSGGYDVEVIDLPQDVRLLKATWLGVWGILAAPPCQHLSVSGAWMWKDKGEPALLDALSIVDACLRLVTIYEPAWWCLENPVGRLKDYLGPWKMSFNPCDFGDPYTKKTCLWGDFNMKMRRTPVAPIKNYIRDFSPSPDRAKRRAITPPGFAKAFFEANP